MKKMYRLLLITAFLQLTPLTTLASEYYVLCEGNFGFANASFWSLDDTFSDIDGPLIWNATDNPLGDVGQAITRYNHSLYIVMNNSHEIRILDLESGITHIGDIEVPGASPRYMAVQHSQERGFVSCWNLGGLLVIDLNSNTVVDTFLLGGLPEELLIEEDRLFVSMVMNPDWTSADQVHEIDISAAELTISETYQVIDGPGSMAYYDNQLYVTSVYYDLDWNIFTGTSKINLSDGSIQTENHGSYNSDRIDIAIINGTPHRTFNNSIIPLNSDLSLNMLGSFAAKENFFSFSIQNNMIFVGSSDYVAPDELEIFNFDGISQGTFYTGGLPDDILYYDSEQVSLDENNLQPHSISIAQNYPNPFNPQTTIPFQLTHANHVSLQIVDITGRVVQTLIQEYLDKGFHTVNWNGKNGMGNLIPSGIYFAILKADDQNNTLKLSLMK